MATRSRIAVMHGDKVKSVYCHWDGYLAYNGKMLQAHYNSAKANELVALGDLSSLQPEIGEAHPFGHHGTGMSNEEYEAKFGNMCTFYGRDRDEKGTEFRVAHTFAEFLEQCDNCGAEYYYIMKDGVWYCGTTYSNTHSLSRSLTSLSEALAKEEAELAVAE
jgi:hypothetical protein